MPRAEAPPGTVIDTPQRRLRSRTAFPIITRTRTPSPLTITSLRSRCFRTNVSPPNDFSRPRRNCACGYARENVRFFLSFLLLSIVLARPLRLELNDTIDYEPLAPSPQRLRMADSEPSKPAFANG